MTHFFTNGRQRPFLDFSQHIFHVAYSAHMCLPSCKARLLSLERLGRSVRQRVFSQNGIRPAILDFRAPFFCSHRVLNTCIYYLAKRHRSSLNGLDTANFIFVHKCMTLKFFFKVIRFEIWKRIWTRRVWVPIRPPYKLCVYLSPFGHSAQAWHTTTDDDDGRHTDKFTMA